MLLVWAWVLWLSYALGTCTLLWVGHGCYCYCMLSEHEHYYGLGMDALIIVCSRNKSFTMVWAWMHLLSYALGTRTLLWFGHGRTIFGMLSEHEHSYGLGVGARYLVCSRNHPCHYLSYALYALGTRRLFWFGNGCTCYRMLSEHERYYGLGMVAQFLVCFRKTNATVVWAWMRLSSYALGTRTLSWFGHGCTSNRMLAEHERSYGLGMDALVIVCSRNANVIMAWAWMRDSMLSEHERYYGLGMDALVIVCSRNTNVIMVWAWMH